MRVCVSLVLCGAALLFNLSLMAGDASAPASQSKGPAPAPLSADEQKVQRTLQEELKDSTPTHRLWLAPDRAIEGVLLSETDSTLLIKQSFGPNNYVSIPYNKSEIQRMERLPAITITPADVRLKMEFPTLSFFKRPPYSVVTDESYFLVRHGMTELERLYEQFRVAFPDWFAASPSAVPVQIVFFGDQEAFRRYATRNAPHLESVSGFYSTEKNRLVLFNQTVSEDLQTFRQKVADLRRHWQSSYPNGIPIEIETQLRLLESRGIEYTYMVIRHEGAHQLLRSYGILTTRPPIPWLEEGLAAYCEMPSLGQHNPYRIQDLKSLSAQHKLIPWRTLVDYQDAQSFMGRDSDWAKAAYAQSWLIAYSLMLNHKVGFFRLLHALNQPPPAKAAPPGATSARLSQSLGVDWRQLETEWEALMQQMSAD